MSTKECQVNQEMVPIMVDYQDTINEDDVLRSAPAYSNILTTRHYLRLAIDCAHSTLMFLLPSFISDRFRRDRKAAKPPHPTAFLDGLRGWAASIIFFHHTHYFFFNSKNGWGLRDDENQWWRLPVIHMMFLGHPVISIFFVVSGFTLSIRPLEQMRSGGAAQSKLLSTLSSATIRRPIRLYGPLVASAFLVLLLGRSGIYEYSRSFIPGFLEWDEHHYQRQRPEFWADFWFWVTSTGKFFFAHIYHYSTPAAWYPWDIHMWTIPVEYRCSFALYLTQLALARIRTRVRTLTLLGLVILAVLEDWWDMMLFWAGMLLCDLYLEYSATHSVHAIRLPTSARTYTTPITSAPSRRYFFVALHAANLYSALHLLSIPEDYCYLTPGFKTICALTPPTMGQDEVIQFRFWAALGAIQLVGGAAAAAVTLPFGPRFSLSALLAAPLSRYLGNISYALYCVHGMINHTIGIPVWYAVFQVTGRGRGWLVGYLVCMAIQVPLTVWMADLFWRVVDKPCVTLARDVEGMFLREEASVK